MFRNLLFLFVFLIGNSKIEVATIIVNTYYIRKY